MVIIITNELYDKQFDVIINVIQIKRKIYILILELIC